MRAAMRSPGIMWFWFFRKTRITAMQDARRSVDSLVSEEQWCGRRESNRHGPFKPCEFLGNRLFRFCVVVLWVVAALRMFAVIAQPGELVVEGLDRGFLLAECFLDEFVALRFQSLLIGEKFIDRVVSHTVQPRFTVNDAAVEEGL